LTVLAVESSRSLWRSLIYGGIFLLLLFFALRGYIISRDFSRAAATELELYELFPGRSWGVSKLGLTTEQSMDLLGQIDWSPRIGRPLSASSTCASKGPSILRWKRLIETHTLSFDGCGTVHYSGFFPATGRYDVALHSLLKSNTRRE